MERVQGSLCILVRGNAVKSQTSCGMSKGYSRFAVVVTLLLPMVLSCSNREAARNSHDRGIEALGREDYDLAITCFTEAIRFDRRYAQAYNTWGYAYNHVGEYDHAIADYYSYLSSTAALSAGGAQIAGPRLYLLLGLGMAVTGFIRFFRSVLKRSRNGMGIFGYGMTALLVGAMLTLPACRTGDVEPPVEKAPAVPAEVKDEGLEVPPPSEEEIESLIRELARELGSQDENARRSAAETLREAGDERAIQQPLQAQDVDTEGEVEAEEEPEARPVGEEIDDLIRNLGDERLVDRESAARALVRIGEPAVKPLIEALIDEDTDIRAPAAEVLGEIRDPRAVQPLIGSLIVDKYLNVRIAAANALEEIGEEIEEFGEEIGDPQAVEPLIGVLIVGEHWSVRKAAAKVLGRICESGTPPVIRALVDALQDPNSRVRYAAAES